MGRLGYGSGCDEAAVSGWAGSPDAAAGSEVPRLAVGSPDAAAGAGREIVHDAEEGATELPASARARLSVAVWLMLEK